ncbi:hypothetical protein ACS8E9_18785 [Pseudomonas neustonica]|uniref:hypothetical protein n=1 Tax=Pseudomonas neustonica TaxID=2487346 RepID=UPI003F4828A3|tara:strand:- start:24814 stop:25095 length:282 start_codon:yes stop_codon:yes gene_type:complete
MVSNRKLNELITAAPVEFTKLYGADHISQADVIGKSWMERYTIALELWNRCDLAARHALAHDSNQSVQAVALYNLNAMNKKKGGASNVRSALV